MIKTGAGFTLLELIVVMMVVGLLLMFGYSNLREFNRRKLVVNGGRAILTDLRFAQSSASSGIKPSGCAGDLVGYEFDYVGSSSITYRVSAICDSNVEVRTNKLPEVLEVNFESDPVIFYPLQGGVSGAGSITVSSNQLTDYESAVSINAEGEIK